MSYIKLLNKIKEYDKITIYKHVKPDGDCVFSSLALYQFLKENFPKKQIKILGNDEFDLITVNHKCSDSFIQKSLGISLDTATSSRIDDFRALACKYLIKIDHHPLTEAFGDLIIVEDKCSSTCELLAIIFLSKQFEKFKLSKKTCEYLYCGMVTDTINFRTTNTTANTFTTAAKIIEKGDLKPSDLTEYVMDCSYETFKKRSLVRNYLVVDDKFGYIKLNKKELNKLKLAPNVAKTYIDEIGIIRDINVWAFAVEDNKLWDVSLRSKRGYTVNKIASKYNGGGHINAAATKKLSEDQLNSLFIELKRISK